MSGQRDIRFDDDHLGHFFLNYMREIPSGIICQIDAATGEAESCGSVLSRSIRLAQRLRRMGLKPGDPLALGGRNHLDVHIPFYAAMMAGLPVAGIDPSLQKHELKHLLKILEPKLVFCDVEQLAQYQQALQELGLAARVLTFGRGGALQPLLQDHDLPPQHQFQAATFNTAEVPCWLCSTSGTTGRPKIVALSHVLLRQKLHSLKLAKYSLDKPRKTALNVSTVHWISGCFNALLMPLHYVKVQASAPTTPEHLIHIINNYKPANILCPPTTLAPLLHHQTPCACDLTCFDILKLTGSKIHSKLLLDLRARVRQDTLIVRAYGLTEAGGFIMGFDSEELERDIGILSEYEGKLVNPDTGKEIREPNVPGELLIRGPMMMCYYKDPKATQDAFDEEGYFKTGDLFYNDERGRYVFVDRRKMLLKYKNYQIVPPDVEEVILGLPGVREVCVAGAPHADDGERAVACVVRQPGARLSAGDVKEHVAKHLSASKHLHGGVVFVDELPLTSSGKVARLEVKKMLLTAHRE